MNEDEEGYWNPMQEYLLNAKNMKTKENKETPGKSEQTDLSKTEDEAKTDSQKSIMRENTKSSPNIKMESNGLVFGMTSKSNTNESVKAPDPLRDNFTSNRTKTHIVDDPVEVPHKPTATEKTQSLEKVASSFLGRIDKIEDENNQLLDDNKRLLDSLKRMDNDSLNLNEKLKYAEDNYQKTLTENHLLKIEKDDLINQIHNLKEDNDKLRKAAHDSNILLKVQMKEFEADKDQWDAKLEDAYSMIKSLESQVESLNEINQQLEKRIASQESSSSVRISDYESKIQSVESLNEHLRETNEQLKVDLEEAENENENLLRNIETLKEKSEKFALLEAEHASLSENLQMSLQSKQELCETLEQENMKQSEKIDMYQSKINELENMIMDVEEKLKEKETEIQELEADRNSLENKLIKRDSESCADCEKHKVEIERLKRKNADQKEWLDTMRLSGASVTALSKQKQDYIDELQKEVVDLRIQNTKYINDLSQLKGASATKDLLEEQIEEIKSSYKRIMEENRRLKSVIAHHNMEETNTKYEIDELNEKYDETYKKLAKANTRVKKLEKLIDEIYDNEEFQHFMQMDDLSSGKSVSLPDISITNTPRPGRVRPSYDPTPRTGRQSKVPTYRLEENKIVRKRKR